MILLTRICFMHLLIMQVRPKKIVSGLRARHFQTSASMFFLKKKLHYK